MIPKAIRCHVIVCFMATCAMFAPRVSFGTDLRDNLIRSFSGALPYLVDSKGVEYTAGKFYGYRTAGEGPGEDAFKLAKEWVDANNVPFFVLLDTGNGQGNSLVADLNDDEDYSGGRYLVQWMNGRAGTANYNCMFTYFKGTSTSPAACADAHAFAKQCGAGSDFPMMVCYWKWCDGTVKVSISTGLSSVGSFEGAVTTFLTKNKPPASMCCGCVPKASAAFAVKDGELKAAEGAAQVYVPFIRTNNLNNAESNWLVVEFPGGTVKTNDLPWAIGQTNAEMRVELEGMLPNVDDKAILVLLGTNHVAVATNSITRAAALPNGAAYPYLPGAVDALALGEWSVDAGFIKNVSDVYDLATNDLAEATAAYDAATNVLAEAITAYDFATNALHYAQETNDMAMAAYVDATNALAGAIVAYEIATNTLAFAQTTNDMATAAYDIATNGLAEAIVAYDAATNTLYCANVTNDMTYTAYTNATASVDSATAAYDAATNTLYYANETNGTATAAYDAATNALAQATAAYIDATNALEIAEIGTPEYDQALAAYDAATNALYHAQETNDMVTAAYDAATNALALATAAYDSATNTLHYASETNDMATAAYDAATNALALATAAYDSATNILYYASVTNDMTYTAYTNAAASLDAATAAYDAATNTLYYANETNGTATAAYVDATNRLAEATAVSGEKATELGNANTAYENAESRLADAIDGFNVANGKYFLVVHGGIVWDDSLIALDDSVFSSVNFNEWCNSNLVGLVYLDMPEPGTGASLFSYNLAVNGNSGAGFISTKGLSSAECAALAGQAAADAAALGLAAGTQDASPYQVALVRADGSVCGYLRPQYNADGTCDLAENMARLGELLAQSADVAEAGNDTVAGAMNFPAVAFGEVSPTNALSVNDTCDVLVATNIPSDTAVTFTVNGVGEAANAQIRVLQLAGSEEISPRVPGIWVFDEEQTGAGLAIEVSAYTDETAVSAKYGGKSRFSYTVTSVEAAENPGKVGFSILADTVKEGEWERVKPGETTGTSTNYQIRVARTEGITGPVTAKISLDMDEAELGAVRGRFKWDEWQDGKSLSWDDLEVGEKAVSVTLFNDGDCYDASNIVFKVEIVNGDAQVSTARFTLTYVEEDPATRGSLEIYELSLAKAGDGKMYVRAGETVGVVVNRSGGSNGNAVGTVVGKIGGKAFETNVYEWAAMSSGFLTNVFTMPLLTAPKTEATFALASTVGKGIDTAKVVVFASDAPEFATNAVTWSGIQYTVTETNLVSLFGVDANMTVKSLYKCHGSVPAGLKVDLVDGKLLVTGTPTTSTSSTATFWVVLTRDGGTLYSMPLTVTFESVALADVNPVFNSACSWTGLPLLADVGGSAVATQRLVGLLDLTVAKNGKTSARYRKVGGKTVSLAASGLAGVDTGGAVKLGALKKVKAAGVTTEYALSATLGADGSLEASVTESELDGDDVVVSQQVAATLVQAESSPWSKDNSAERFGGDYAVAFPLADPDNIHSNTLCTGATSMRLKFSSASAWRRGIVTFAGWLPNGKSVSGSACLVPTVADAASASLPLFASSSSDTFSAMVDIGGAAAATEGVTPYWRHDESKREDLSYENDCRVVGSAYASENWATRWVADYGVNALTFAVSGDGKSFVDSGARLKPNGSSVAVSAKGDIALGFTLNRTSGIAAGTFKADTGTGRPSTLNWRGVVLPGKTPFLDGAYWYNWSSGKRTVRRGGAVRAVPEE